MKISSIIILVVISVSSVMAANEVNTWFGLEGRLGFGGPRESNPYGLGGSFRTKLVLHKLNVGGDFSMMILSNWEDTLDLADSPDTTDIDLFDIWIRRGTDVSVSLGPKMSYRFIESGNFQSRIDLGLGALIQISSFDDMKEPFSGAQVDITSDIETDVEFYLKPRVELQLKRVYLAYEYFLIAENLEHAIAFGIIFF